MGDGSGLGQPSDSFYSSPGGSNTCIPNTIGKREMSRMSRPTSSTPPRGTASAGRTTQQTQPAPTRQPDEVVRLQREVAALRRENTEAKAEKTANDTVVRLQREEHVHFRDEGKTKEVLRNVYMAGGDEAVTTFINDVILPSYPREEADPTNTFGNDPLARFSRRPDQAVASGTDLNDPATVQRLAREAASNGMSWEQAVASFRQKNGQK